MPMRDPVAVYNAASNLEAHLICNALVQSDIEAMVVEDTSVVGVWFGGVMPEIHKPQIWIERGDLDQAKRVIEEYELRVAAQRDALAAGEPVFVVCEECGKQASYPPTQRGTVQDCPHCAAYVDVDDTPWADVDDFGETENP
jgi:hypothetical protein